MASFGLLLQLIPAGANHDWTLGATGAREAGVKDPAVDLAIERSARLLTAPVWQSKLDDIHELFLVSQTCQESAKKHEPSVADVA